GYRLGRHSAGHGRSRGQRICVRLSCLVDELLGIPIGDLDPATGIDCEKGDLRMNSLLPDLKPRSPRLAINSVSFIAALAGTPLDPWVVDSALLGVGFVALIYAMRNFTWNIAGGLLGMLSLAHVAAYGIGAFAVAILTWGHGVNVWIAILIGMLISALVGVVVSL